MRPLKGDAPVSFDDPAAACRSRARWHRHHQAYREGGGLNLDTLISLLRALDKLHNLDAVLFESELRNFHESYEGGEGSGRLQVRQQAADLNNKSSAPQSEEVNYSAALENSLCW